jgi:hypothetical protein
MAQDCPHCGLTSPPGAQRCDCGYDFTVGRVADSYLTNKQRALIAGASRRTKILSITFGTLAALWALRSLAILPAAISSSQSSAYAAGSAVGGTVAFAIALSLSIFFFRKALKNSRNH